MKKNCKGIDNMRSKVRILSFLLAVIIAAAMLPSCSDRSPTALEYEGVRVNEKMYGYWLSHYKYVYLRSYAGASDSDAFWNSELEDGQTANEYLTSLAVKNIKRYVAGAWMFDHMGLKLTSDMKNDVKQGIDDMIDLMFDGDGDRFDAYLESLGIDRDVLYDAYIIDVKLEHVREYLYGVNGIINVPDSDRMIYLNDNYVRIEHIYINNKYKLQTDENGEYIADENGYGIRTELTEDELAEKNRVISLVEQGIEFDIDFEELREAYSEDQLYPGGYYLLPTTPFISDVVEASLTLQIGEIKELETEYGTHFIRRMEMEGTPWDDDENKDFFEDFEDDMRAYLFTVMIDDTADKVTVYDEITGGISLRDVPESPYA